MVRREGVDVSGEEGRGWCEWWGLGGGGLVWVVVWQVVHSGAAIC